MVTVAQCERAEMARHYREMDRLERADDYWKNVQLPHFTDRILNADELWDSPINMTDVCRRAANDLSAHGHSLDYCIELLRQNARDLVDAFRPKFEEIWKREQERVA